MVKLIEGKGSDCNGYLIGNIAIDAPLTANQKKVCNCQPDGCHTAEHPDAELLIITHPHCDHFLGASNYSCKKASSEKAKKLINSKSEKCLCSYIGFNFPSVKIDSGLKNGEKIKNKETELEVILTPGHCGGSICLYEPNKKILFSGDTVFPDYNLPRTDLPSSNFKELKKSYEKLSKLEIEIIYPGHGGIIKEKDYIKKLLDRFFT